MFDPVTAFAAAGSLMGGSGGGGGFFAGLGKALPGIISGIGSLFGGGGESSSINLKALVKQAEKAGFNPLTVLRAGGGAGFVQTHTPALAGIGTLANAAAQGIDAWMNFDPAAEQRAKDRDVLEMKVLEAELGRIQSETHRSRSFNVPSRGVSSIGSPAGTVAGTAAGSGGSMSVRGGALPPMAVDAVGSDGQIYDAPNPDVPVEAEQDIWRWVREGKIVQAAYAIAEKNGWSVEAATKWLNDNADKAMQYTAGPGAGAIADWLADGAENAGLSLNIQPPKRTAPKPSWGDPFANPGFGWPQ